MKRVTLKDSIHFKIHNLGSSESQPTFEVYARMWTDKDTPQRVADALNKCIENVMSGKQDIVISGT